MILCDTGPLYALADQEDSEHQKTLQFFDRIKESLIISVAIVPEVCYLMQKFLGPRSELAFLKSIQEGEITLEGVLNQDWDRAIEILEKRPELGFVDSVQIALAERLGIKKMATFDRRHFASFKPKHVSAFEILS